MKKIIFCVVVSAFLLGAPKLGIYEEVTKAVDNTKELYSQVQQLQKHTKTNDDIAYTMTHFSESINQVNKQIDENFELLDKLEKKNKNN